MKKFLSSFARLICLIAVICSCSQEVIEDNSTINVNFSLLLPNVSYYDEILTRAENNKAYSYGIRIEQYNDNTKSFEPYATGVFDDISKASIELYKSRKYNIEAAVINNFYSSGNQFQGYTGYIPYVGNYFEMKNGVSLKEWLYHNVWDDAYYGAISDFKPTDSGQCSINLKSETAGLRIAVEGMTKGSIRFSFNRSFTRSCSFSLSEQTEISLNLAFDSWLGRDDINDYEIGCIIEYVDENNSAYTLVDKTYSFTKGYRKVFNIVLNDSSNVPVSSGFSLSFQEVSLTESSPVNLEFTI